MIINSGKNSVSAGSVTVLALIGYDLNDTLLTSLKRELNYYCIVCQSAFLLALFFVSQFSDQSVFLLFFFKYNFYGL